MNLKQKIISIFKSLNPDSYSSLKETRLKESFEYFFFVMLMAVAVMLILLFVKWPSISQTIDNTFNSFDTFNLSADVEMNKPVTLMEKPLVKIDFSKNMTDETLFINKEALTYKTLFGLKKWEFRWNSFSNILANKEQNKSLLFILILLLLPSLALWVFVLFSIKYLAMIFIASFIAFIVLGSTKYKLPYKHLLNMAIFASTIFIILELAIFPYYRFLLLPIILFLVLFILAIALNAEKKGKKTKEESEAD